MFRTNVAADGFLEEDGEVWSRDGQLIAIIDTGIDMNHSDLQVDRERSISFVLTEPLPDDLNGHGTHVAGTIGVTGVASNGYYKGVAPDVKLVGLGAGEVLFILTATQAYDWVLTHHDEYDIRVISNSWGSTGGGVNVRNPVVVASLEAYNQGILSVFAAGNDGGYDVMNPYSIAPWVVSVAAGTHCGACRQCRTGCLITR